jgi:hypothetical protein
MPTWRWARERWLTSPRRLAPADLAGIELVVARIWCQPREPLRMPWQLISSNLVLGGAVIWTAACALAEARALMRGRELVR